MRESRSGGHGAQGSSWSGSVHCGGGSSLVGWLQELEKKERRERKEEKKKRKKEKKERKERKKEE